MTILTFSTHQSYLDNLYILVVGQLFIISMLIFIERKKSYIRSNLNIDEIQVFFTNYKSDHLNVSYFQGILKIFC